MTLLNEVMERPRADYRATGRENLFDLLEGNLTGGKRRRGLASSGRHC